MGLRCLRKGGMGGWVYDAWETDHPLPRLEDLPFKSLLVCARVRVRGGKEPGNAGTAGGDVHVYEWVQ